MAEGEEWFETYYSFLTGILKSITYQYLLFFFNQQAFHCENYTSHTVCSFRDVAKLDIPDIFMPFRFVNATFIPVYSQLQFFFSLENGNVKRGE